MSNALIIDQERLADTIGELREFIKLSIERPGVMTGARCKADLLTAIQLLRELEGMRTVTLTYLKGSRDFSTISGPSEGWKA